MDELSNNNDNCNISKTTIYNQLTGLIVRDSIATLPSEVLKVVGFELLEVLARNLIKMRTEGVQLVFIDTVEPLVFFEPTEYKTIDNFTIELKNKDGSRTTKTLINNNQLLIFGDLNNRDKGRVLFNEAQKQLILMYDDVFKNMYQVNKAVSLWYMKVKDLADKTRNSIEGNSLKRVVNNLLNRNNKNLTIMDKEDDINLIQANLTNTMINEVKEHIATVFGIPFSKLFKGTSSGFNNLDKNDLENWNFELRYFQGVFIMPLLKKIYALKNKENDFKNLNLEPILYENKQISLDLKTQELDNIIKARSMNLITPQQAGELAKNILNIEE